MPEYTEVTATANTTDGASMGSIEVVDKGYTNLSSGETSGEETSLESLQQGASVIVRIGLAKTEWALNSSGKYAYPVADGHITHSSVLHITGIDTGKLEADLDWVSADGYIYFTSDSVPNDDIVVDGVLEDTGDSWEARGHVSAFPGAGLKSARYRHSLHAATLPVSISAQGTLNVETALDFSAATLVMAAPEWTGHSHVMIPRIYKNSGGKMCFTLTNLGTGTVSISEVLLRILYRGTLSGLVTDTTDDAGFNGYITDTDIDEAASTSEG